MNKKTKFPSILLLFIVSILFLQFTHSDSSKIQFEPEEVFGFSFLEKIPGLWSGPVSTDTPAGNFDNWYVDFRPVSPGQVSQYTLFDSQTINNLTFFIVKHENQLKVAMRTEGCFDKKCCVTYEVMDKVDEEKGYYRFSDFQSKAKRAFTEFTIKNDEFLMEVYTNKFNKLEKLELHSRWNAKLGDRSAAKEAITHFNFPQPIMVKDFTDVFKNMKESIYYVMDDDPYSSDSQPYVGNVTVNIEIDKALKVKKGHELFILLTTESLFDGLKFKEENYKYFSKYVFLPIDTKSYTIKNVHPGKYYLYSYNDINGDRHHKKGDYMSSDLNNIITVPAKGTVETETKIDFVIP